MPGFSGPAAYCFGWYRFFVLVAITFIFAAAGLLDARAGDTLRSGNAVITGFSGTKQADDGAGGGDPLDETFIDLDGASMQIQRITPSGPPDGQVISAPVRFKAKASDVGQVFAIALDAGDETSEEESVPNIYLGATSVFGIQIVLPDSDGDGRPERIKNGHPNATFMPGQFGPGGGPGSIWKVDGKTGEISLFATIPGNTGPGIGDIVYDPATRQFFVSDLDTGLIHRLASDGTPIDVFDHGEFGRAGAGLELVSDDGRGMDIKDSSFDALNSETWGLAPPERMVWGLGLHGGRLYYAVAKGPEIWSVGINLDGSFAEDPRREIEVVGTPENFPISDIAFDNQGYMYVAQRGGIRGSWDYSAFTEAKKSVVFRFQRELPDDPETPGTWVPIPEAYAVGFPPDYRNTSGGIALGYGYDEVGKEYPGTCSQALWSTGDDLRDSPEFAEELAAGGPAAVHGLQGNDRVLTRPDNEPPGVAYFVDYDGKAEDPEKIGHIGDVEILQPCATEGPGTELVYELPPWSGDTPPAPTPTGEFNLAVDKIAQPEECWAGGAGWECGYTIRVSNTGTEPYFGDITLTDWIPDPPLGSIMHFAPQPPWNCTMILSSEYQCTHPATVLYPGESIDLFVTIEMPAANPRCYLDNAVQIDWLAGYGDSDPSDDFAFASALIPSAPCAAPAPAEAKSNLAIKKYTIGSHCSIVGTDYHCGFLIEVANTGPGVHNDKIDLSETLSAPATSAIFTGPWSCSGSGANYTCSQASVALNPGQSVFLAATFVVPQTIGQCQLGNLAQITHSPAGSDANTDGTDDSANAAIIIPSAACIGTNTNLKLEKSANPQVCAANATGWTCGYGVRISNAGSGLFTGGTLEFNDGWGDLPAGSTLAFDPRWTCATTIAPSFKCSTSGVPMAPGAVVESLIWVNIPSSAGKCSQSNTAVISQPAGGSPQNSDATDDKDDASAAFALFVTPSGDMLCGVAALEDLEERIGPMPPPHDEGEDKEDEKPEKEADDDTTVCPTGWTKTPIPGKCCPHNTDWDGERCVRSDGDTSDEPTPECWSGWEQISAKETEDYLDKGYQVRPRREGNKTIWCARGGSEPPPPPPPPADEPTMSCLSGWFEIGGNEVQSYKRKGYRVSPRGKGRSRIWCAKEVPPPPTPTCGEECQCRNKGWNWSNGRCRPPCGPECQCRKKGWDWSRGRCQPPCGPDCQCRKKGWQWSNGRCQPPCGPDCQCRKKGGQWSNGKCQPPCGPDCQCRRKGWQWSNGKCQPPCGPDCQCRRKGWQWSNGKCQPPCGPDCQCRKKGWQWSHGKCQPPCGPDCQCRKTGGNWVNGRCQRGVVCWNGQRAKSYGQCPPKPTGCPAGQYFSPKVKRCVPLR